MPYCWSGAPSAAAIRGHREDPGGEIYRRKFRGRTGANMIARERAGRMRAICTGKTVAVARGGHSLGPDPWNAGTYSGTVNLAPETIG